MQGIVIVLKPKPKVKKKCPCQRGMLERVRETGHKWREVDNGEKLVLNIKCETQT